MIEVRVIHENSVVGGVEVFFLPYFLLLFGWEVAFNHVFSAKVSHEFLGEIFLLFSFIKGSCSLGLAKEIVVDVFIISSQIMADFVFFKIFLFIFDHEFLVSLKKRQRNIQVKIVYVSFIFNFPPIYITWDFNAWTWYLIPRIDNLIKFKIPRLEARLEQLQLEIPIVNWKTSFHVSKWKVAFLAKSQLRVTNPVKTTNKEATICFCFHFKGDFWGIHAPAQIQISFLLRFYYFLFLLLLLLLQLGFLLLRFSILFNRPSLYFYMILWLFPFHH